MRMKVRNIIRDAAFVRLGTRRGELLRRLFLVIR